MTSGAEPDVVNALFVFHFGVRDAGTHDVDIGKRDRRQVGGDIVRAKELPTWCHVNTEETGAALLPPIRWTGN
jgi:hypothetical protein